MVEGVKQTTRTPLTTAAEIRSLTGYSEAKDVSDGDLAVMITRAQAAVLHRLAVRVDRLELEGDIDGSNRYFRIPLKHPARVIVDDTLNLTTDASDVLVETRDDPEGSNAFPTYASVTVSSVEALGGVILLQAAPATTIEGVHFTGLLMPRRIDKDQLKYVVELHVCHQVDVRARKPGGLLASQPFPDTGRRESFLRMYEAEIARLTSVKPRAAATRTRIPGGL